MLRGTSSVTALFPVQTLTLQCIQAFGRYLGLQNFSTCVVGKGKRSTRDSNAASQYYRDYLARISSPTYVQDLLRGLTNGQRLALSRSLTLCESSNQTHRTQATQLLKALSDRVASHSDVAGIVNTENQDHNTLRLGISGTPGVGKSTLIEALGCKLADDGHKVAVLAIDPSGRDTGGSILGDKTRMPRLSSHPNAYVRPSPTRGTIGGIARATYDSITICEAAGYNFVIVETVGVGQNEVQVADLVDCTVLVAHPAGGDDLQMMKRGIMEIADIILVNKADGPLKDLAKRAVADFSCSLALLPTRYQAWTPSVLDVSAHTGHNLDAAIGTFLDFQTKLSRSGELLRNRRLKREQIVRLYIQELMLEQLSEDPCVKYMVKKLMPAIHSGAMPPRLAAEHVISYFLDHCR